MPDPRDWEVRRRRGIWRTAARRNGGVTAVLLDIGGVVIPTLFESVDLPGFPRGPLDDEPDYARVERGETSERAYWEALDAREPDIDVGSLWRCCSYVRGEMLSVIAALLSRLRVVAFTNDMGHWFGDRWRERFPELDAFDEVIEASTLGALKPKPEAYLRAADHLGEQPARCLLVDDQQVNLDGAAAVGMHTQLFDVRRPQESAAALLSRLAVPREERSRVFTLGAL